MRGEWGVERRGKWMRGDHAVQRGSVAGQGVARQGACSLAPSRSTASHNWAIMPSSDACCRRSYTATSSPRPAIMLAGAGRRGCKYVPEKAGTQARRW